VRPALRLAVSLAGCALAVPAASGGAAPHEARITDAPLRITVSTSGTFGFRGPRGALECAVDRRSFRRCSSPASFGGLRPGRHTFRLRGAAGAEVSYRWTILRPKRRALHSGIVARPVMTTVPLRPWTSGTATFAWRLPGDLRAECALDRRAWSRCTSPRTVTHLHGGGHVFRVRARTSDGRPGRANRFSWTIWPGTLPPAPVLLSRPGANTTATAAVFRFEVRPGDDYECRLDPTGWQRCSNPAIYVGLGTGPHTFCARALAPSGIPGPETCFGWFVHSPGVNGRPAPVPGAFTIHGHLPGLLRPGTGGPLSLTIANPLAIDLTVTGVVVTVAPGSSRPGCDGPANLAVAQSSLAGDAAIVVPAGGAVTVPAAGATAPVVTMRDLPTNQDACKGATFTLVYSGRGSG
jgi:hypothetical protein